MTVERFIAAAPASRSRSISIALAIAVPTTPIRMNLRRSISPRLPSPSAYTAESSSRPIPASPFRRWLAAPSARVDRPPAVNCRQSTDASAPVKSLFATMAAPAWMIGGRMDDEEHEARVLLAGLPQRHVEAALAVCARSGRVVIPAGSPGDLDVAAAGMDVLLMISGEDAVPAVTWRATFLAAGGTRGSRPAGPPAVDVDRGTAGRRRDRYPMSTRTTRTTRRRAGARSRSSRWSASSRCPSTSGSSRTSSSASRSVVAGRSSRERRA